MIPLLAAPAAKILAAVLTVASIGGGGYYLGYTRCDNSNRAGILMQAIDAAENVRVANDNLAKMQLELNDARQRHDVRIETVEKVKVKYVQSKATKCSVSPELERAVDSIVGLHNAPADGVPSPATVTDPAIGQASPAVTDAALLGLVAACTGELYDLYDNYYKPLSDYVVSSRVIALEGAGFKE